MNPQLAQYLSPNLAGLAPQTAEGLSETTVPLVERDLPVFRKIRLLFGVKTPCVASATAYSVILPGGKRFKTLPLPSLGMRFYVSRKGCSRLYPFPRGLSQTEQLCRNQGLNGSYSDLSTTETRAARLGRVPFNAMANPDHSTRQSPQPATPLTPLTPQHIPNDLQSLYDLAQAGDAAICHFMDHGPRNSRWINNQSEQGTTLSALIERIARLEDKLRNRD